MEGSTMPLDSARQQLAALEPLAKQLNAATDAFTEELKGIEGHLGKLAIGVAVEQSSPHSALLVGSLESDNEGRQVEASYLAYDRHNGKWRLLVRTYEENRTSDGEVDEFVLLRESPLIESSRELRLAASGRIAGLLEEIGAEAKNKLKMLEQRSGQAADQTRETSQVQEDWVLDRSSWSLVYFDKRGDRQYAIPLKDCKHSAAVLDMLVHIAGKRPWGSDAAVAGLLRKLDRLLHFQSGMCASGASGVEGHTIDPMTVAQRNLQSALEGGLRLLNS